MRPIPVVFHLGPLQVHTYGIGLALTFWFGYRYFARRLRAHGYPDAWLGATFVWIVAAAIVGARVVHVLANLGYYEHQPAQVLAIWNGGLSSFGGLALAVPVGLVSARRRCPQLRAAVAADLVAPVLIAAWALGRLLGPQLMVAGGGKPTSAWFGMYYAGEVGRRLPVPIFQALECTAVYLVALFLERRLATRPVGLVTAATVGLWGLSRFFDEFLWLPYDNGTDAVEIGSLVLFAAGAVVAGWLVWRARTSGVPVPARPLEAPGAGLGDRARRSERAPA
ncbi:MAG TPA: prolipoprotein diacylglyceryl transferase family protein [Acidimicrobiales bacterium]|nr:prolipoprotein diacylglyceryl transferase family protein [Acidimicrobiales bacterium]